MKILYCTPSIYNSAGTERVLSIKVNYLVRNAGYEVVIVTTDQLGKPTFFKFDERIKHYDLDLNYINDATKPLFSQIINHYKKNRIYRKRLKKIIETEKPDVCVSLFGKEMEFLGNMNLTCKTVGELHFNKYFKKTASEANHKGLIWKLLGEYATRRMIAYTKKIDSIVVLTKQDMEEWQKTNNNVCQIYNPVPMVENQVDSASLEFKNMIAVGRLCAQKNYNSMVRAWRIVQKKHPDWKMNVWGDGELKDSIEDELKRCGIQDTFVLHGRTDNVNAEYLKNSAFVMTSIYEGFPMVLLEAASFGLPMISYACYCGPKDIIKNGYNGFLIEQDDEKALADAICKVIEDKELRINMGKNSKETAKEFSQYNILPLWPTFFEKLVKG
ncbi:MAG: glycosyltransferase family 4 protein [Ruminococcus flavefaciens]|nr:glycosyltransferase family 4 protein [Bacteroides sp.]MCM1233518.1 glycosyltransferase family 4 protein [Ruminococcus flavefaciens]